MTMDPVRDAKPERSQREATMLEPHRDAESRGPSASAVDEGRLFFGWRPLQPVSGPAARDPDEAPVSWEHARVAPPNPFEFFSCTVTGTVPSRTPGPVGPATPRRAEPTSAPCASEHHHEPRSDSVRATPELSQDRREGYWAAFAAVSQVAEERHEVVGERVEEFRHAERDQQLRALGYIVPVGFTGDLWTLTDAQHVPYQDGMAVGALFDGEGELHLDKHEQRAIDASGKAMGHGKGGIERSLLVTVQADEGLKMAISSVGRAAETLSARLEGVHQAIALIEASHAAARAGELRAQLDQLRADTARGVEIVGTLMSFAKGVVHGAEGEIGDAIGEIGTLAATIMGHLDDPRMHRLEQALEREELAEQHATEDALAHGLKEAKLGAHAAMRGVSAASSGLNQAMTQRRLAYNDLGLAAGRQVSGPQRSRRKIAAILAAIPLVELVVGRARALAGDDVRTPEYDQAAGRGLGMALYHDVPVARAFLRACGELTYTRDYFGIVEGEWQQRLFALRQVKDRIGGRRPGLDDY